MRAGDVLDQRYHIIELVGKGRSEVFLARDDNLTGKLLAVKVIKKTSKDFDSFMREKTLLAKLSHPGIPTITQQIETETECCVVMNYYNGETLYHRIKREKINRVDGEIASMKKREDEVLGWFKSMCEILIYIHTLYKKKNAGVSAPVIHRDIKPENIMLEDSGVRLIDWGIAGEFRRGVPDMGPNWGTPCYAAPEQCPEGAKYIDERTDIFSLGATMYYALTSEDPPKDKKNIPPVASVNPNISEGMGIIVDKCLQYNPEKRYQSASELLDDLNHIDNLTKQTKREKQRSLVFFGLCILICLIGSLISIVSNSVINSRNSDNFISKIQLADAKYDEALYYQRNGDSQKSKEALGKAAEFYKQAITYDKSNVDTYLRLFECMLQRDASSYSDASYNAQLTNAIDVMRRQYIDEKSSGVYHSNRLMYSVASKCLTVIDNPVYSGYAVQYLELIKESRAYRNNDFNEGFSKIEIDSMYLMATSLSSPINENNISELVEAMENLETETENSSNSFDEKLTNYLNLIRTYNRYSTFMDQSGSDPYAAILRIGQKSREAIESLANYSESLSFNGVIPLYQTVAESLYEQATLDTNNQAKRVHYEQSIEWIKYLELFNPEMSAKLLLKYGNCYRGIYESYIQGSKSDSDISNSGSDASYLTSAREIYERVLLSEDTSPDIVGTKFSAQVGITFCCAYNKLYYGARIGELKTEYAKTVQMMKDNQNKLNLSQLSQYQSLKSFVNRMGVE